MLSVIAQLRAAHQAEVVNFGGDKIANQLTYLSRPHPEGITLAGAPHPTVSDALDLGRRLGDALSIARRRR